MFGQYLKQLRLERGLTQKDLCALLNLSDAELASIDAVTISRWERGITKPHASKSIKILRTLTLDLVPYLVSRSKYSPQDSIVNRIVFDRFNSINALIQTSSYTVPRLPPNPKVVEKRLNLMEAESVLENIRIFLSTSELCYPNLDQLDLYQLYRDDRLLLKVYIDQDSLEIVGHNLSVFFEVSELESRLKTPYDLLPFRKVVPYTTNSKLAICNLSRFAANRYAFEKVHGDFVKFVARHSNIHIYYHYLNSPLLFNYLVEIGAEKVGYDTLDPYGVVKVGNQSFRNCLLKIDTATILARPEIAELVKKATT